MVEPKGEVGTLYRQKEKRNKAGNYYMYKKSEQEEYNNNIIMWILCQRLASSLGSPIY